MTISIDVDCQFSIENLLTSTEETVLNCDVEYSQLVITTFISPTDFTSQIVRFKNRVRDKYWNRQQICACAFFVDSNLLKVLQIRNQQIVPVGIFVFPWNFSRIIKVRLPAITQFVSMLLLNRYGSLSKSMMRTFYISRFSSLFAFMFCLWLFKFSQPLLPSLEWAKCKLVWH